MSQGMTTTLSGAKGSVGGSWSGGSGSDLRAILSRYRVRRTRVHGYAEGTQQDWDDAAKRATKWTFIGAGLGATLGGLTGLSKGWTLANLKKAGQYLKGSKTLRSRMLKAGLTGGSGFRHGAGAGSAAGLGLAALTSPLFFQTVKELPKRELRGYER